ncbi:MAG: DUF308 domain-containing protein [Firmicutes bacterium]|nr:DUF308 domain-containing protein [Bacillota bacterium]
MKKEAVLEWFKGNTGKILISIIEIVVGILLFINPIGFTSGIIIACGVVMLLLGLVNVIKYFTTKAEIATEEKTLFSGLLLITVGIFCTCASKWFIDVFSAIPVIYGIVLLLFALKSIQATADMIRLKDKKWYLELIASVLLTVFVILIFVNPFGAGMGIWIFTGIILIVCAIYNIVTLIVMAKPKKIAAPKENTAK